MHVQRVWKPISTIAHRPVTSIILFFLVVFKVWLGVVLINTHLNADRLKGYAGPLEFFSLHAWGYLFMAGGFVTFVRMFFMQFVFMDFFLHIVGMSVTLGWALCFDFGPMTTGQPAYTFVAAVSILSPYLRRIILAAPEIVAMRKLAEQHTMGGSECEHYLPR